MNVEVITWGPSEALARVDGVRVRIRRYKTCVVWLCAEHGGQRNAPTCEHALALADTPAPADLFVDGPRFEDRRSTNPPMKEQQ